MLPNFIRLFHELHGAALVPVLFAALAFTARREGSGRRALQIYLACYGVLRFVLEFFRGDDYRGFLGVLSVSQVLSLAAVGLAAALCFLPKKKTA